MEALKALFANLFANHKMNMTVVGLVLLALSQWLQGNSDAAATSLVGAITALLAKIHLNTPKPPDKPQDPPTSPPAMEVQEAPRKVPHNPFQRFVACLVLCFGLWHVGHALAATLPATVAQACKKCDRPNCDCGCKDGRECDCKLIQAQPSEFSHLPSHALCKQNHALAVSYCESLEKLLDLLSGRVIEPEEDECVCGCCCRRGPEIGEVIAGGWKVEQLQQALEDAKRRRVIWDTAAYVTCPQTAVKARQEFGKRLRLLVGERAYVTGEFPGPLP